MHVLIMTFSVQGLDDDSYRRFAHTTAPRVSRTPGLAGKVWIADEAAKTYGGVYLFEDRAAVDAYLDSDLMRAVRVNPHIVDLSLRVFAAIEAPTRITQGRLPVYPSRAPIGWEPIGSFA